MFNIILIITAILLFATAIVMTIGIVNMMRGDKTNQQRGNRLMQWRVTLQAASLVSVALLAYLGS